MLIMKKIREYYIPGEKVKSLEDFYKSMGEVINGPGGFFGTNLDAFLIA